MFQFILRRVLPEGSNPSHPQVRRRCGLAAGGIGVALNLTLFLGKLCAGALTGAISVTADAFNNLSDAGSSVVTLVGFKMAGRPADSEHPFGHGRFEYLSALFISLAILLVGWELLKGSFEKILSPEPVSFQILPLVILGVSILVKLWMAYFNRALGRRIDSAVMRAAAADSRNDAIATAAVLAGMAVSQIFHIYLDPWLGLLVALFILHSGFSTARESLSPLLGQAPDPAFVQEIQDTVLAHSEVAGIHDLIVHDYGPGRRIISLHAEVPSSVGVLEAHDVIDRIELELRGRFGCDTTIHMDPLALDDPETLALRGQIEDLVRRIDPSLSIHDFRAVKGPTHTNLIFDLALPHRCRLDERSLARQVRADVHALREDCYAVIRVERAFLADAPEEEKAE